MSLQPCLTCEAMISSRARRCPQCGEPQPHATSQQKLIGLGVVILIVIGVFTLMAYKSVQYDQEMRDFRHRNGFPANE